MRAVMWILLTLVGLFVLAVGSWYAFIRSVETPRYELVRAAGAFEVRDYPPLVAAEVARRGSRQSAVSGGFGPLAAYIFARERSGASIPMTAPVTQTRSEDAEWQVRFIMPSKHTLDSLPPPVGNEVRLVELPPQRYAVVRFSGRAGDEDFAFRTEALRTWLADQGLLESGPATLAYYDDPLVPGFLRRNEVLIPVEADDD